MEQNGPSKRLRKRKSSPSSDTSQPEPTNAEVNENHSQQENSTAPGADKDTNYRTSGRRRKSSIADGNQICPVCGITVRPSELEQHFQFEVQQIDHIIKRGRIVKDAQASYALSKLARETENGHGKRLSKRRRRRKRESDSEETPSDSDSDGSEEADPRLMLLEVRGNRHARERKKELKEKPELNPETMLCPICFQPLIGSEVDRNRHVESCLSKPSTSQVNGGSESSIDVDGDGQKRLKKEEDEEEEEEEHYETYEWMGETRIRACSLVPGGYQGLGFPTISSRLKVEVKEEEDDLDVDGDETQEFGPQQYHEEDVLARCPSRSSQDTGDVGYEDHVSDHLLIEGCVGDEAESNRDNKPKTKTETETKDSCLRHVGLPSSGIQMVVESLKARVRELEERSGDGRGRLKCQICMGDYNTPLVSVQCWHVHCEECWLNTLASKKLCPQCQMITSASQLRRIYL